MTIDDRKLGICPICGAGDIWTGVWEFATHIDGCVRIAAYLPPPFVVADPATLVSS